MSYIYGVDVSWPNGNYRPGPESFIIVGAVSLDGGDPFVQETYRQQVDTARAAGKEVGHYAFNGRTNRLTPTQFADYFVDHLYDYRPGDVLVLDVESSEDGKYPAWSPSQAREFRDRVQSRITTRLGVYGNRSDMGKAGWGALHNDGTWLWIAWPGDESRLASIGEWGSDWQIWQYSSEGGLDRNHAKQTLADLAGADNKKESEDEEMKSFLIYIKNSNGTMQWAHVSGDLARFVPIWLQSTANELGAALTGPALEVGKEEWNGYRAAAGLPADTTVG